MFDCHDNHTGQMDDNESTKEHFKAAAYDICFYWQKPHHLL